MPCPNYSCGLAPLAGMPVKIGSFNLGCELCQKISSFKVRIHAYDCSYKLNIGSKIAAQNNDSVQSVWTEWKAIHHRGNTPETDQHMHRHTCGKSKLSKMPDLAEKSRTWTTGQNRKGWVLSTGTFCCINHWATMLRHLSFHTNKHIFNNLPTCITYNQSHGNWGYIIYLRRE